MFADQANRAWFFPRQFGAWNSVFKRFTRWCKAGVWAGVHAYVAAEPDLQQVSLDSTIIRAHAGATRSTAEREALGRSRGGFTTKIHALTDALGYPVRLILAPGQDADITQAENVLEGIQAEAAIADKAYDADSLIQSPETRGTTPVIPPQSNRTTQRCCDWHVYKERHLIESFFGKIKHHRRVFSWFEKKGLNCLAFVQSSAFLVWTRKMSTEPSKCSEGNDGTNCRMVLNFCVYHRSTFF